MCANGDVTGDGTWLVLLLTTTGGEVKGERGGGETMSKVVLRPPSEKAVSLRGPMTAGVNELCVESELAEGLYSWRGGGGEGPGVVLGVGREVWCSMAAWRVSARRGCLGRGVWMAGGVRSLVSS